jgi:hypothetical protein
MLDELQNGLTTFTAEQQAREVQDFRDRLEQEKAADGVRRHVPGNVCPHS